MTRQEAIERLNKMRRVCDMEECNINCELCDEALDLAIEALQQTEIVRCKDCMYCNVVNTKYAYAYCMKHGFTFYPFQDDTRTNYCSWGERKE